MRLEKSIEFLELAAVERDDRFGFENALILVQVFAGRQRPQKSGQAFNVAGILQDLADAGDLRMSNACRNAYIKFCSATRKLLYAELRRCRVLKYSITVCEKKLIVMSHHSYKL